MENRNNILTELQEIAPTLSAVQKVNAQALPEGYFVNFQHVVLERIKLGEVKAELKALAPALALLEKPVAAQIPANYLQGFSAKMISHIRAKEVLDELTAIAPQLADINKVNVLEVPAAYFTALPQVINEKIKGQQAGKVTAPTWVDSLNIFLDRIAVTVFKPKYAMAFSGAATMVFIGALMFIKIGQCTDLDCRFAQLSNDEINSYLDTKTDAYSDEVFEGNFDAAQMPVADKDNTLKGYKEALKDVSDAELNDAIAN